MDDFVFNFVFLPNPGKAKNPSNKKIPDYFAVLNYSQMPEIEENLQKLKVLKDLAAWYSFGPQKMMLGCELGLPQRSTAMTDEEFDSRLFMTDVSKVCVGVSGISVDHSAKTVSLAIMMINSAFNDNLATALRANIRHNAQPRFVKRDGEFQIITFDIVMA